MQQTEDPTIPTHVGFIVDGNRRWAKTHGLPQYEGHLAGYNVIKDISRAAVERGVKYVSFYVFSTENWKRSQEEVSYLMKLVLRMLTNDINELIKEKVRVRILGARDGVSDAILKAIDNAEAKTAHFTRATVSFCFNYGGHQEIVDTVNGLLAEGKRQVTADDIRANLYGADIPDVDLVVRTSGEQRLSNFMLWRVAYSEMVFVKKFWPDLRVEDIGKILKEYARRNRRFGG